MQQKSNQLDHIEGQSQDGAIDLRAPKTLESLLDRVTVAVNSSVDLEEILERLAGLALEACPADRCGVFLLDESGTKLVPRAYVAAPHAAEEIARYDYATRPHFRDMRWIDLEADPSRWQALERGKAFAIPDLAASPLVPPEVVTRFGSRSAVVVPLIAPAEPLGVLALDWTTPQEDFPEEQIILVEAIGAYACLAIRNARLIEKMNEKTQLLEGLVRAATGFNSSLSTNQVHAITTDSFRELFGSDDCAVDLLEGEAGEVDPDAAPSDSPDDARATVAVFPLRRSDTTRGFVSVPVGDADAVPPARLELGRALAELAATAMERAELYDSLTSQLERMGVLHALSDAVADAPDFSAMVPALNRLLGAETGLEVQSIQIDNDRLRGLLDASPPRREELAAIRSWRGSVIRAGESPRVLMSEDGGALVPAFSRGRVLGVLRVSLSGRPIDSSSNDLLLTIGTVCSEVIQKAGLRRDLAESQRQIAIARERERIAADLHGSVGQLVTSLGMQLASYASEAPDEEWRGRLEKLVSLTAEGSRQMRDAIHSLLFLQVQRRGLVESLRELAQTFEATSGVATHLRVVGDPVEVEPAKEDALFRVAHEAFTNVQRHSGSSSVAMTLTYDTRDVVLTLRDQGSGLGRQDPSGESGGHFGLHGIQQQVEEVGGELVVANAHPRGVLIEARVRSRGRGSDATRSRRRH